MEELDVLDAVSQRTLLPSALPQALGHALEGVQHDVACGIPDGMNGAGKSRGIGAQDVLEQLLFAHGRDARGPRAFIGGQHGSGLRAKSPIGKHLHGTQPQQLIAKAASKPQ